MAKILLIVGSAVLVAGAIALGVYGWTSAGDTAIGLHGWLALILGAALTALVGGGLVALVFFSSRAGYDEGAHYEDDPDLTP